MPTNMLIDARHGEETRVSVIADDRLLEFDYESASKVQLKGNVYLAKVTRVEPSLQAAFVEYGGNRQGFLAFSEIHPDYYQIPVEDREAILAEEKAAMTSETDDAGKDAKKKGKKDKEAQEKDEARAARESGNDDIIDETLLNKRRLRALKRRYKIQEVIRKRQILLVQVVKEERGSKGAAVTTYLSLPGRYCVLMPNTTHGNGISRKIGDAKERQRLKKVLDAFTVPTGMGCIIRTAGMGRTKAEIKRDLDYLFKTWEEIRESTLKSVAPELIFEEGNLIKRSLRDLYDKHINEVLVEGDDGFKLAKDFMKRLMPSHAKKVKQYEEKVPLFQKFGIEDKIDSLFASTIALPSGGYIVINPTEALVAIDVNSGKATKEHNIEETALQTNLEAAQEIARQLRLRDIAGLIVIDFIDMEVIRNVRTIEKKFREALKADRARLFTSRISALGLLEMSRQRLRSSLYEISTQACPHCEGSGRIPSPSTLALRVTRKVEDLAAGDRATNVVVHAPQELALFLLNSKRHILDEIETRFGVKVLVNPTPQMRMPYFEVRAMSDEQLQREAASFNSLFAAGLVENVSGEETVRKPVGFGKADGRGRFPGKKRRRGKRGGARHRPGRGRYDRRHKDARQEAAPKAQEAARDAVKDDAGKKPRDVKKPADAKPAAKAPKTAKPAAEKTAEKAKPAAAKAKKPPASKAKAKPAAKPKAKAPAKAAAAKTETASSAVKKKAAAKTKPKEKPAAAKTSAKKPTRKGWWNRAGAGS